MPRSRCGTFMPKAACLPSPVGIANYPEQVPDITQLMERADESLYLSKRTGRNRVMQYGEEITAT